MDTHIGMASMVNHIRAHPCNSPPSPHDPIMTGKAMYESDDIINYVFDTYGPGAAQVPRLLKLGPLTTLTAGVGLMAR